MNLRNRGAVNLLDLGVVGAADVRSVEDAVAGLLGTTSDVLLVRPTSTWFARNSTRWPRR